MSKQVLIICLGNICRSPTAEYLLRQRLLRSDVNVSSAGLGAPVGKPMDATAAEVLLEHGIDGSAHRARQFVTAMLHQSDLVLAMETSHLEAILHIAPEVSGKAFLLGKWHGQEIPDPYRRKREAFEHAYRLIDQCVTHWSAYLYASIPLSPGSGRHARQHHFLAR